MVVLQQNTNSRSQNYPNLDDLPSTRTDSPGFKQFTSYWCVEKGEIIRHLARYFLAIRLIRYPAKPKNRNPMDFVTCLKLNQSHMFQFAIDNVNFDLHLVAINKNFPKSHKNFCILKQTYNVLSVGVQ